MGKSYTPQEKMDIAGKEIHKFLAQEFGIRDTVPYQANNRLRTTLGRICTRGVRDIDPFTGRKKGHKVTILSSRIEYNARFLEYATVEEVIAVGKHEAVHYACMKMGKPSSDGHPYFESVLNKYKLPSQKDFRGMEEIEKKVTQKYKDKPKHYVECSKCGKLVATRKITPAKSLMTRYRSGCCKAKLLYAGVLENKVAALRYKK